MRRQCGNKWLLRAWMDTLLQLCVGEVLLCSSARLCVPCALCWLAVWTLGLLLRRICISLNSPVAPVQFNLIYTAANNSRLKALYIEATIIDTAPGTKDAAGLMTKVKTPPLAHHVCFQTPRWRQRKHLAQWSINQQRTSQRPDS